jgi:hypothetical protein
MKKSTLAVEVAKTTGAALNMCIFYPWSTYRPPWLDEDMKRLSGHTETEKPDYKKAGKY